MSQRAFQDANRRVEDVQQRLREMEEENRNLHQQVVIDELNRRLNQLQLVYIYQS